MGVAQSLGSEREVWLSSNSLTALHFNKAEVAHPSFTTSSFTAPRLFSSFTLSLQRSAARTATRNQHQSLLSCTVLLTSTSTPTTTTQKRSFAAKKKMPPKKAVKEEKLLLGRPGNNLKSGIVGLANVGKSTLFQAITKCHLGNPAVSTDIHSSLHRFLLTNTRTSPSQPLIPKNLVSLCPTSATTGSAKNTTPSQEFLHISPSMILLG